jgi:inhibitor of KinA sporulation pathway (predicted exonuclease)
VQFIIFDLEATCWSGNSLGKAQEIIEVGAVRLTSVGEYSDSFQSFVRPVQHPMLSAYCQELTGIDQVSVNRASYFDFVMERFLAWMDRDRDHTILCSWGARDIDLLKNDCFHFDLDTDWLEPHIDVKAQYHRIRNLTRKQGLYKTIDREGFEFEGSHHRALDDAVNTAKLFVKYLDEWRY